MFDHSNDAVFTVATTGCVAMVTNRHPATRACSTTNNTFIKYHILHKVPFIKYKYALCESFRHLVQTPGADTWCRHLVQTRVVRRASCVVRCQNFSKSLTFV